MSSSTSSPPDAPTGVGASAAGTGPASSAERFRPGGMSEEEARARIAAQMPLVEKCALADVVIDNGGARADTERRARELWRQRLASLS